MLVLVALFLMSMSLLRMLAGSGVGECTVLMLGAVVVALLHIAEVVTRAWLRDEIEARRLAR
jgi:hypothetical protein